MGDGTEAAPGAESTQGALLEVVKGLRHEPPLLFGIGAGLVLVAILAATTSIAVVAIVAVVLVAALAAWLVRETKARTADESYVRANTHEAEIADNAEVGSIDDRTGGSGRKRVDLDAGNAKIGKGAVVGRIRTGAPRRRRRG